MSITVLLALLRYYVNRPIAVEEFTKFTRSPKIHITGKSNRSSMQLTRKSKGTALAATIITCLIALALVYLLYTSDAADE